jgi:hypothetical protein
VFSNEVGVFCQCHGVFWEIKKVDERVVISHQHKKKIVNISSPILAYLENKLQEEAG